MISIFKRLKKSNYCSEQAQQEDIYGDKIFDILNDAAGDNPQSIFKVAEAQMGLVNKYYKASLERSRHSFRFAVIGGSIGICFFIASLTLLAFLKADTAAVAGVICGAFVELITAVNLYLYGQATAQMTAFLDYLDNTQKVLLADSICEKIKGEELKQKTQAALVESIMKIQKPSSDKTKTDKITAATKGEEKAKKEN